MFASTSQRRTESITPSSSQRLTGKTVLVRSDDPYKRPLAVLANHYATEVSYSKKVTIEEVTKILKSKDVPTRSFGKGPGSGGAAKPYVTTAKNLGNKRNPNAPVWIVQGNDGLKDALKQALKEKTHRNGIKPVLITPRSMKLPPAMQKLFGSIIPLDMLPKRLDDLRAHPQLKKASLPGREQFLEKPIQMPSATQNGAWLQNGTKASVPATSLRGRQVLHPTGVKNAGEQDLRQDNSLPGIEQGLELSQQLDQEQSGSGLQSILPRGLSKRRKRSTEQTQGLQKAQALLETLEASGVQGIIAESRKEMNQLAKQLLKSGYEQQSPLHYTKIGVDGTPIHTVIVPVSEKGALPYQPDYDSAMEAAALDQLEQPLESDALPGDQQAIALEIDSPELESLPFSPEQYQDYEQGYEQSVVSDDYEAPSAQKEQTTRAAYDLDELARYEQEVDERLFEQGILLEDDSVPSLGLEVEEPQDLLEDSTLQAIAVDDATIDLSAASFAASTQIPSERASEQSLETATDQERADHQDILSLEEFSFPDRASTPRLFLTNNSSEAVAADRKTTAARAAA